MICNNRIDNICLIGTNYIKDLYNIEIVCKDDAFKACTKCKCPHTLNYVSASLIISQLFNKGIKDKKLHDELMPIIQMGKECAATGPGFQLKRLLNYLNITSSNDCNCESYTRIMNEWGSKKCRREIATIVSWLEVSSNNSGLNWVFNKRIAATLVIIACELDEGKNWIQVVKKIKSIYNEYRKSNEQLTSNQ